MDNRESVGVVSGAYFVGRIELLEWINDLTRLNYTKIEQTSSGVFACHVFDALYPGKIRLDKVKFNAKQQHELVHNYKVLQACFARVSMKRQIDVEKLIKGKYQDNLEFIQWVKAYYDSHACERALSYDGAARREDILIRTKTRVSPTAGRQALVSLPANRTINAAPRKPVPTARPLITTASSAAQQKAPSPVYGTQRAAQTSTNVGRAAMAQLKQENEHLQSEMERVETALAEMETEREFYFNKLRNVEILLQGLGDDFDTDNSQDMINMMRDSLVEIKSTLYAEHDQAVDNDDVVEEAPEDEEEAPYEDAEYAEEPLEEDAPHHEEDQHPKEEAGPLVD